MTDINSYEVLVRQLSVDEGGGWLASVPDLPGCMSDGETPEEARENVRDAIEQWIETARSRGWPIPSPAEQSAHVKA